MRFYQNKYILLFLVLSKLLISQKDTITLNYKFERCIKHFDAPVCYDFLKNTNKYSDNDIIKWCTNLLYHGNENAGYALQQYLISKMDTVSCHDYQEMSVQHTKNGDYEKAINFLEKAIAIDSRGHEDYYGWVLLYYYRDYDKALKHLNHFDDLTPSFVDAPVGENIYFLKGLCHYQKNDFINAIKEFELNRDFEKKRFGKKNCNTFIYFYLARCYEKMGNLKLAKKNYKLALSASNYATEANYYLGLLYIKQNKKELATKYVNYAYNLLKLGYKQQDIYVELFDEIYLSQIEETLTQLK